MDDELLATLPTASSELLASVVGHKLTAVRRFGGTPEGEDSTQRDGGEGDLELTLDDGRSLVVSIDEARRSVVVREGSLAGGALDVSQNAFWRWRLRREVAGVAVWKSLDVPAQAAELEFGLELRLRIGPPAVMELIYRDGVPALVASDGEGAEPHRWLGLVGEFPPPPAARPRALRSGPGRTERPGRRRKR